MDSKPLSYDAMKVLMEYLPFTTRTKLARRCPSLRKVEKVVPLRLQNASLGDYFTLDNTQFQLHIIRKCPDGVPAPRCFQHGYNATLDTIDKYGCPDVEDTNSWTPGDIVRSSEDAEEEAEDPIAFLQERIDALRAELPEDGEHLDDLNRIEVNELDLQAYMNRRDNILSPFQFLYRLKVIENGEETQCFYSEIDMPFSLKLKQLSTLLFGGRQHPISAKVLNISAGRRTIRMPPDTLFKVYLLCVQQLVNNSIPAASALHHSSFPLNQLKVNEFQPHDFSCPIVRDSQRLFIDRLHDQPVVDFFTQNYHPVLYISNVSGVSYNNVIEIITQAMARGRDFFLSLEFETPPNWMHRSKDIARQFYIDNPWDYIPMRGDLYLAIEFDHTHPFKVKMFTG